MANIIHPLAFVDPTAKLGDNVKVDAFAFIDRDTVIGDNCKIRPHASVLHNTILGNDNEIFEGAVIGANPQDFRWHGEQSFLRIGNNNKIHEHVIINRSIHEGGYTEIGNNTFIMAQTHISHDCKIGNWCVLGNGVKLAGDVTVGNYVILSSSVIGHECSTVGEWTMIKGGARFNGNVPPFVIMAHNPIDYYGVNAYILRKGNMSEDIIDDIAKCYRLIYQSGTSVRNALLRIREDVKQSEQRDEILRFIEDNNQKIVGIFNAVYD